MSLTIVCTDGSTRIINVTEHFFKEKEEDIIVNTKKLCHDFGPVRKVELRNGDKLIFEQSIDSPALVQKEVLTPENVLKLRVTKRNRQNTVKRHKKRLVNPTFTMVSRGSEMIKLEDLKKERIARRKSKKQAA